MTYRLFVSPRGFANEGTIYEFDSRADRDAAYDHLGEIGYADDPDADYRKITSQSARAKIKGDAATQSYVGTATAREFAQDFHAAGR